MIDPRIILSLRALARDECAYCQNGFCLKTDERCHLIREDCDTLRDGLIACDYFYESVLPAGWNLTDLIAYSLWYAEADADEDLMFRTFFSSSLSEIETPAHNRFDWLLLV